MTARRTLTLSIFTLAAGLALTGHALAAWTETQNGTTYRCEEIQSEQCKVRSNGEMYDCKSVKKTKCVAIKGPGSGQALTTDWDQPPQPKPPRLLNFNKNAVLMSF
jgi:hypothetical protein